MTTRRASPSTIPPGLFSVSVLALLIAVVIVARPAISQTPSTSSLWEPPADISSALQGFPFPSEAL